MGRVLTSINKEALALLKNEPWEAVAEEYRLAKAGGIKHTISPVRIARAVAYACGIERKTPAEVMQIFGEDAKAWVTFMLKLNGLPEEVQVMFDPKLPAERRLTGSDAQTLFTVPRDRCMTGALNLLASRTEHGLRSIRRASR